MGKMEKERGLVLTISEPYIVTIDYTKTWEEHINLAGFVGVNKNITSECFEINGDGVVSAKIVFLSFNTQIYELEVGKAREENGLRPISFEHQLAFSAQYPKIRDKRVNLDSKWQCNCSIVYSPYQHMWLDRWELSLARRHNLCWDENVKFFALKE